MFVDSDFFVRFWGVRGSIPCPGPDTAIYGGNTPCVEIRCGSRVLIFDAGTGIRRLANTLSADNVRNARRTWSRPGWKIGLEEPAMIKNQHSENIRSIADFESDAQLLSSID